ncbi:MAG: ABC transporter permease [Candidatus Alcyoniella australis]|nr:ABC transporter permease [Candidatus Alcyoniella australis]
MSNIGYALGAIRARAYVRVVGANRELSWTLSEIVLPVLSMVAYVMIYKTLFSHDQELYRRYAGLVIIGGAMVPFWLVVLWSMASQFYWEKEMGNLDLYMASPMHPMILLLGMAAGGAVMALGRSVVIVLLGLLVFKVPLAVNDWPALVLAFVLCLAALFSMGMAMSSVYFMVGRAGIKVNMLLMEPIYLLTGFYFPARALGPTLSMAAALIPLTIGLDAIRQVTGLLTPQMVLKLGPIELSAWLEIGILAVMSVVFTIAAFWLMAYMQRMGKREGKMTLRWQ